jgi:hypothetical protein
MFLASISHFDSLLAMTTKPQVRSQFTITLRCLCYRALYNIRHGALKPIGEFPTTIDRYTGGTVIAQVLEFNVPAKNATWNVLQLVQKGMVRLCAWFVSHSDVDLEVEVENILHDSGFPYEYGSRSQFNNEKAAAEAVLVINRYDWGYYDNDGARGLRKRENGNTTVTREEPT